jgi:hypothetical protein
MSSRHIASSDTITSSNALLRLESLAKRFAGCPDNAALAALEVAGIPVDANIGAALLKHCWALQRPASSRICGQRFLPAIARGPHLEAPGSSSPVISAIATCAAPLIVRTVAIEAIHLVVPPPSWGTTT